MSLDEATLEEAAQHGEMDYEKWPAILEPLLERLHQIVHNEFPLPRPYATVARPRAPSSPTQTQTNVAIDQNRTSTTPSQTPSTPVRNLPPVPPFPSSSATNTSRVPDSFPPSQAPESDALSELPTLLLQLLNTITATLRSAFSERPPHTVQRLAELVLHPTKHYKTLPAWLRAVDRVVSVSSPADIFPLSDAPPIVNGVNGDAVGGILWNNNDSSRNGYDSNGLGSDESLGGALLTPIPWLRNGVSGHGDSEESNDLDETAIDGESSLGEPLEFSPTTVSSHSDPLVPEREDGAVTQGELLRMEQEAGVIPVNQHPPSSRKMAGVEDGDEIDENGDVVPHARGPDLVGAIDIGRVDGKDVQVRIGSPPEEAGTTATINPADAQDVSTGTTNDAVSSDADGFELVGKAESTTDEMQVDSDDPPASTITNTTAAKKNDEDGEEDDGDIVLVDADGKMDDEIDLKGRDISGGKGGQGADAGASSNVV